MEVQFIQAWTGSSPYPEVVLSKQHLTQIALGDTSYTRGGGAKKILLKGIQLRGNVDFFNTGVNSGAYLTIVVVYDKDPVGSTANVVGDFLAANAGTDANSNSYNVALNNDGNAQRFRFFVEWTLQSMLLRPACVLIPISRATSVLLSTGILVLERSRISRPEPSI